MKKLTAITMIMMIASILTAGIVTDNITADSVEAVEATLPFSQGFVYVAKNGDDTAGDGSYNAPFLTFTNALASITNNGFGTRYAIIAAPGDYLINNPLQMKSFVNIVASGNGFSTRFKPSNPSANMIEMANFCKIAGFSIVGVTNAIAVNMDTAGSSKVVDDVAFSTCKESIVLDNPTGGANINNVTFLNLTTQGDSCIDIREGRAFIIGATCPEGSLITEFIKLDGSNSVASIFNCVATSENLETGISIQNGATVFGFVGTISEELISVDDTSTFAMMAINDTDGDLGSRVYGELAVGTVESPAETVMGGGDSYVRGMLVYTYDGSTYSNVTVAAASASDSTFTFPNTNVNSAIYVSSTRQIDGDSHKFTGLKMEVDTVSDLGTGGAAYEYYNGAWVPFNVMLTDASAPYSQYAGGKLPAVGSFQLRADNSMLADWTKNDPTGLGSSNYWVRVRTIAPIISPVVLQQIKVHTDRTEVNGDGFMEFFGAAESTRRLIGASFEESVALVGKTPVSENIEYGTVLEMIYVANEFVNNSTDGRGGILTVPLGLDTSRPLTFEITMAPASATTAGDAGIVFYYGNMPSTVVLDGTNPEVAITNLVPIGAVADVQYETSFTFPVNTLIPGDRIPFGYTRPTGDEYDGTVYVIDTRMTGTFWR